MTSGYIYCFTHVDAPGRVKVGFSGRDPNICVSRNRECRASKLNNGLQVFGFAPVENGFEPRFHVQGKAIDQVLKKLLKPFQVSADQRGRLTEAYIASPEKVLELYEKARTEVEERDNA